MGLFRKFLNQTRKPEGTLGKLMLAGMSVGHASVANWAMSLLTISEPQNIVDIGCGNGRDVRELAKKYSISHVTAIDYSPLSVEKARKTNRAMIEAGRVNVEEGDVSNLKLTPEKFDLATAFETIYFWPGLAKCFGEVRKILKLGGNFMIVIESDGHDKISQWFKARIDGMNTYTADEIEAELRAAGFQSITINHHAKFPWLMFLATK